MRGLNWMVEQFHSVDGVLAWAFKHQYKRNHYGPCMMFRDVVVPDMEPVKPVEPAESLMDFGPDDYLTVSGKVLKDTQERVGDLWPVLVLAYNSWSPPDRLEAAIGLHPRIRRIRRGLYPRSYFIAVAGLWRVTSKARGKLLLSLAFSEGEEITERTELRWRSEITGRLDELWGEGLDRLNVGF